ncbi:response regulator transcription factor [Eggerthella lenta]|uniref:response regulator transcription factor n=1 Tax=Eggerthella lenta TaxID=84112 RepID=UPI002163E41A|nr:helix-turn-helix transcriptional regulator [Eggerthella lenta]
MLALLLEGKDNQNIASALTLSLGTVKAHVHNIYRKANVSSRQQLLQSFWKED